MITIIDNKNRNILNEGRSNQMGFAFLKKLDETKFETVQPISPCKDYLNVVVWAEHVDKQILAYGLNYIKQNIFNGDYAYICFKMCPYKYDNIYNKKQLLKDIEAIDNNYQNLNLYINEIEKLLDLKNFTIIKKLKSNLFLVYVPIYWTTYTYTISLYSLLLRACQLYNSDDGDVIEYLSTNKIFRPDIGLIKTALPKLQKLIKTGLITQDLQKLPGTTTTHNMGICGFKFE